MPIYELKCQQCGHEFEFLKVRSVEEPICDNCGAKGYANFDKQVSQGTSFDLKGKGWYKDDYTK